MRWVAKWLRGRWVAKWLRGRWVANRDGWLIEKWMAKSKMEVKLGVKLTFYHGNY
jgi:hypothetical protein